MKATPPINVLKESLFQGAEGVDPDEIRICNCARCRKVLVAVEDFLKARALSTKDKKSLGIVGEVAMVAERIDGRPFCEYCLNKPGIKKQSKSYFLQ